MKKLHFILFIYVISSSYYCLSQNRTNKWVLPGNFLLDFNVGSPTCNFFGNFRTLESSASICDHNGNLLFYTNGDSILGVTNQVLQNGYNLSLGLSVHIQSTTQGALFVPFLGNDSIYYEFTNCLDFNNFSKSILTYSIIHEGLSSSGEVLSKQNIISSDTLSEKMVITKHCNGKFYWLVVIKYSDSEPFGDGLQKMNKCIFYSYLIDDLGVRKSPIQSEFDFAPPQVGQMKFNLQGTQLAYATDENLYLFDFDSAKGIVTLNKKYGYNFENGYGLEWSPDGKLIYVNEKQVELATGNVYHTQNQNITQLQLANNGRIYGYQNSGVNSFDDPVPALECFQNTFGLMGTSRTKLFEISNPNNLLSTCNLDTNFINNQNSTNSILISLPNLPHFLIFEDSIDFTYKGNCLSDTFQFSVTNNVIMDSVFWEFIDENQTSTSSNPNIEFTNSGISEVVCTVYFNGIAHTIKKCIIIIGDNTDVFDSYKELCPGQSIVYTATEYIHSTYLWSNGDTTATTTISQPGNYTLQTSNSCGVFTDQITLAVLPECFSEVIIPNVITTNSDNVNDLFSIKVKNISTLKFRIINRWGVTMIVGSVSSMPSSQFNWIDIPIWDGKSTNGIDAKEGVYFYVIDTESNNGELNTYQGFLTLIN
jgi:hypothetical protein